MMRTFHIRVGPELIIAAAGVLVAVAHAVVGREGDLPVALGGELLAEAVGHGHPVPGAQLRSQLLEQVRAEGVAFAAHHLLLFIICVYDMMIE